MVNNVYLGRLGHARLALLGGIGLLVVMFGLTSGAVAQATNGTGHQNARLAVSVSVTPDTAVTGDTVTATEKVTNTSTANQTVVLLGTLTTQDGQTLTRSASVVLAPGKSWTQTQTYTVAPSDPRGLYSLRLDATSRNMTSSATGTVTYV
jgi:uncharacterized protein (DUF58 family)